MLSWSSGKDSAWCLKRLRDRTDVDIVGLLTTFNESADRVAMHAVRRQLVEKQAAAIGLPLFPIMLPWPCSNDVYEAKMAAAIDDLKARVAITGVAFGDLFLEDIRRYREERMAPTGLACHFPIWGEDTRTLAREMVSAGTEAVLTCVDPRQCPGALAGRRFDEKLLADLPGGVDPCGENGEFHTFVHGHPEFTQPISIAVGATLERDGFVFADVAVA